MKVLITGGTGTISYGLVKESVRNGFETYTITRGNRDYRHIPGAITIRGDLWDRKSFIDKICDIHFDVIVECNVYNTPQLKYSLETFKGLYKQFVFISSAIIALPDFDGKIREEAPKDIEGREYVRNKIACERYLADFFQNMEQTYTIVRPFFTYGAYHIRYAIDSVYDEMANIWRIENELPVVCGKTVQVPVVYLDDFSTIVVSLFLNEKAYNETIQIAEKGNEITWEDVYTQIGEALGKNCRIVHIPDWIISIFFPERYEAIKGERGRNYIVDDTKIKRIVPHAKQIVTSSQGLSKTVASIKEEHAMHDMPEDDCFRKNIDASIVYAYNRRLIEKDEIDMVEQYFEEVDHFIFNNEDNAEIKLTEFNRTLINWVTTKQKGIEIASFLKGNNYNRVAIYGMKELGYVLHNELISFDVPYVIDKMAEAIKDNLRVRVILPEEYYSQENVDVVIVTAIHYYEDIFLELWKQKKNIPILSLDYLMRELILEDSYVERTNV